MFYKLKICTASRSLEKYLRVSSTVCQFTLFHFDWIVFGWCLSLLWVVGWLDGRSFYSVRFACDYVNTVTSFGNCYCSVDFVGFGTGVGVACMLFFFCYICLMSVIVCCIRMLCISITVSMQ